MQVQRRGVYMSPAYSTGILFIIRLLVTNESSSCFPGIIKTGDMGCMIWASNVHVHSAALEEFFN